MNMCMLKARRENRWKDEPINKCRYCFDIQGNIPHKKNAKTN